MAIDPRYLVELLNRDNSTQTQQAIGGLGNTLAEAIKQKRDRQLAEQKLALEQQTLQAKELQNLAQLEQSNRLKERELAGTEQFRAQKIDVANRQLANKAAQAGPALTPGQEAIDKSFGRIRGETITAGGTGGLAANMAKLDDVEKFLSNLSKKPKSTQLFQQGAAAILPDSVRGLATPELKTAEQDARSNVLAVLRQTLGSQFTQREGERIFSQTFDPTLPPATNLKRVQALKSQLKDAVKYREAADRYFTKNKTLQGFNISAPVISGATFTLDDVAEQTVAKPAQEDDFEILGEE